MGDPPIVYVVLSCASCILSGQPSAIRMPRYVTNSGKAFPPVESSAAEHSHRQVIGAAVPELGPGPGTSPILPASPSPWPLDHVQEPGRPRVVSWPRPAPPVFPLAKPKTPWYKYW